MTLRFRLGRLGWGFGSATLLAFACSGSDEPTPQGTPGTGGTMGRGGTFGTAGMGAKSGSGGKGGSSGKGGTSSGDSGMAGAGLTGSGADGGEEIDPKAPIVEILYPPAEDDPNGEGVIIDQEVDVLCKATRPPGGTAIKQVTIEELDKDGEVVQTLPGAVTDDPNEFTARVITSKVPTGVVGFRCVVDDIDEPTRTGKAEIEAFVDHGPKIMLAAPMQDAPVALKGLMHVEFTVEPVLVAKGDKGATIDEVTLAVDGVEWDITLTDGVYSAAVDLEDPHYLTVPDGETPLIIRASNKRKPGPATAQLSNTIFVDGAGPLITVIEPPKDEDVRGGKVDFSFSVTDDGAGVDPASVVALLNNGVEFRFDNLDPAWTVNGSVFTFNFDTTQLTASRVQATLAAKATDIVGNLSSTAVRFINLDEKPPIVDLDPPVVRESRKGDNFCSLAFDPVGPKAANDKAEIGRTQLFRALVYDMTNEASTEDPLYFAAQDPNSVYLYLQPRVEQGLLIDTNEDGFCDNLLREDSESGQDLPVMHLKGILPVGSSWFGQLSDGESTLETQFPMPEQCVYSDASAPEFLCPPKNIDDMRRIVKWDPNPAVPMIYGIGNLEGDTCTGTYWEIGSQSGVQEGWLCVAAVAEDQTHNVGISQPLRLCYNDHVGPDPDCSEPPPSCVRPTKDGDDECILPPKWRAEQVIRN